MAVKKVKTTTGETRYEVLARDAREAVITVATVAVIGRFMTHRPLRSRL
jgi:hypothetical protein